MIKLIKYSFIFIIAVVETSYAQTVSQFQQFYGNYDFTMIGNTFNVGPNGVSTTPCEILTSSSANLNLDANQTITAAYLYWAGSGNLSQADLNVNLNGIPIEAERTFTVNMNVNANLSLPAFGAFADVTSHLLAQGNGAYTLSDFDITAVIPSYCPNGLNFGGWSIVIIYEDLSLPSNVVNVYDGFQIVDMANPSMMITLSGLNVIDVEGAKIGFLGWEGDLFTAVTEELRINDYIVSNPPLNPANNVFNSSNSFLNTNNLWNMDLDYFSIEDYISVGDTSLDIEFRTGQDLVIAQNFVVTLNSQLPDASIDLEGFQNDCNGRKIDLEYTVNNTDGTANLPVNTPISFYINEILIETIQTPQEVAAGSSETFWVTLTIPPSFGSDFVLESFIDDNGNGVGVIQEINEDNNRDEIEVQLKEVPKIQKPEDIIICDEENLGQVLINLTEVENQLNVQNVVSTYSVLYYLSEQDLENSQNPVLSPSHFAIPHRSKQKIFVKVIDDETGCSESTYFEITVQQKPFAEYSDLLTVCTSKDSSTIADLTHVVYLLNQDYDYVKYLDLAYYHTYQDAVDETQPITSLSSFYVDFTPYSIFLKVKGKNEYWCDHIIEFQVVDCVVPKGISPNGDGLNDAFDLSSFQVKELQIFNRYGTEVYFYGKGYTNQWYGQTNEGNLLPDGTYFYVMKTERDIYTGYVQLLKGL